MFFFACVKVFNAYSALLFRFASLGDTLAALPHIWVARINNEVFRGFKWGFWKRSINLLNPIWCEPSQMDHLISAISQYYSTVRWYFGPSQVNHLISAISQYYGPSQVVGVIGVDVKDDGSADLGPIAVCSQGKGVRSDLFVSYSTCENKKKRIVLYLAANLSDFHAGVAL